MEDNYFSKHTRFNTTEYFNTTLPFSKYGTRDVWKLQLGIQEMTRVLYLVDSDLNEFFDYSPENTAFSSSIRSSINSALVQIEFFNR